MRTQNQNNCSNCFIKCEHWSGIKETRPEVQLPRTLIFRSIISAFRYPDNYSKNESNEPHHCLP